MKPRWYRRAPTGIVAVAMALAAVATPAPAFAREVTLRSVSLDVKSADIRDVFRLLARVGDVDIVVAEGVKGRVTVSLVDVPWADAFNAILVSQRLGVEKVGDILVVDTLQHITERAHRRVEAASSGTRAAPLKTILIPVDYADAEALARIVSGVLTERGSVLVDQRTNTLIVTDVDDTMTTIQGLTP